MRVFVFQPLVFENAECRLRNRRLKMEDGDERLHASRWNCNLKMKMHFHTKTSNGTVNLQNGGWRLGSSHFKGKNLGFTRLKKIRMEL